LTRKKFLLNYFVLFENGRMASLKRGERNPLLTNLKAELDLNIAL
jgi:hypothetical protein